MKRAVLLVALLLLGASLAFGDVTFYLYVNGTTDSTLDIPPGETAELWVRLYADGGNAVSGAVYDVQLPMEGWTLASREYSDLGVVRGGRVLGRERPWTVGHSYHDQQRHVYRWRPEHPRLLVQHHPGPVPEHSHGLGDL